METIWKKLNVQFHFQRCNFVFCIIFIRVVHTTMYLSNILFHQLLNSIIFCPCTFFVSLNGSFVCNAKPITIQTIQFDLQSNHQESRKIRRKPIITIDQLTMNIRRRTKVCEQIKKKQNTYLRTSSMTMYEMCHHKSTYMIYQWPIYIYFCCQWHW